MSITPDTRQPIPGEAAVMRIQHAGVPQASKAEDAASAATICIHPPTVAGYDLACKLLQHCVAEVHMLRL